MQEMNACNSSISNNILTFIIYFNSNILKYIYTLSYNKKCFSFLKEEYSVEQELSKQAFDHKNRIAHLEINILLLLSSFLFRPKQTHLEICPSTCFKVWTQVTPMTLGPCHLTQMRHNCKQQRIKLVELIELLHEEVFHIVVATFTFTCKNIQ